MDDKRYLRLGVNVDHVATVRNARGIANPDPVRAALMAAEAGADGITAHLREDRRHIVDDDIERLISELELPLNFEMAATDEMRGIVLRHKPLPLEYGAVLHLELFPFEIRNTFQYGAPQPVPPQTPRLPVDLFPDL